MTGSKTYSSDRRPTVPDPVFDALRNQPEELVI